MSRPSAVILAGGLGTRLRSVLPDLPKPMAPVAGRPFVEWVVRFLARQSIRQIVLSTGYKASVVEEHFARTFLDGVEVRCAPEPSPLGTAGGFLHAVRHSGLDPKAWLVSNGDSLAVADLEPLLASLDDPAMDGAVLALWMEDASRYGSLEMDDQRHLTAFLEKRPGAAWINAGVYLFRRSLLDRFSKKRPLSFETDVFPALLAAGARIWVHKARGSFLDIGLPETLVQAEEFIRRNASAFS
jgi:D-glycero-alpha-D-manno-heptose 1-phosphate guanylyltransferase